MAADPADIAGFGTSRGLQVPLTGCLTPAQPSIPLRLAGYPTRGIEFRAVRPRQARDQEARSALGESLGAEANQPSR